MQHLRIIIVAVVQFIVLIVLAEPSTQARPAIYTATAPTTDIREERHRRLGNLHQRWFHR
jgi:hypothetical protein